MSHLEKSFLSLPPLPPFDYPLLPLPSRHPTIAKIIRDQRVAGQSICPKEQVAAFRASFHTLHVTCIGDNSQVSFMTGHTAQVSHHVAATKTSGGGSLRSSRSGALGELPDVISNLQVASSCTPVAVVAGTVEPQLALSISNARTASHPFVQSMIFRHTSHDHSTPCTTHIWILLFMFLFLTARAARFRARRRRHIRHH